MYIVASQRYFAYGEYTLALRLTSELVDLRAGYAKRIQWAALIEPLLRGLCVNMMQTIASYLRRGIEEVITGLTRNQFVDNTTRGFESLPLRQRFNLTHSGWIEPFFLAQGKWILTMRRSRRVRIPPQAVSASRGDISFTSNQSGTVFYKLCPEQHIPLPAPNLNRSFNKICGWDFFFDL